MKFQIYGWYFTSFILKIVKGKWIPFKGELARAPQHGKFLSTNINNLQQSH